MSVPAKAAAELRVPAPESAIDWGELAAALVKVNAAERAPSAEGVRTTDTLQLTPLASEAAQVLEVVEKSAAFVPLIAKLVRAMLAPEELLRVTVCGALA